MPRIRKSLQEGKKTKWNIALYIRLSKEDGNDESLSVSNQRKILADYLMNNWSEEDYFLVDTYADDGLTGTDTNRENFMRMRQDIVDGKVNCVIVKSLARAFRNLADQQKFLEEFLPLHKARFINLGTPFIDTFVNPNSVSGFEVPIRGMFNEQFAAATSEEIRKTFNMKRKRGEFIGSFAPFGYKKDPKNKNKLLVDEEAAQVVRDIFNWFLYGVESKADQGSLSINGIARELNERGVPSPITYKKQKGLKYQNPNNRFETSVWTGTTVGFILRNQMYIGDMVQGRQRVISYKIHKQMKTTEDEWFIKENTHEAIIESEQFEAVQQVLLRDTKTAPGKKTLYLFSGFLKCADCGRALHRRSNTKFSYYYCRTSQQSARICEPRSIREDLLNDVVLSAIQMQISLIEDMEQMIDKINHAPVIINQSDRLNSDLEKKKSELTKNRRISDLLYTDWRSGDISRDEYLRIKSDYAAKNDQLESAIQKIESERQFMSQGVTSENSYFKGFLQHKNVTELTREVLVELVDSIAVHEDRSVEINFSFQDQFQRINEFIENNQQSLIG